MKLKFEGFTIKIGFNVHSAHPENTLDRIYFCFVSTTISFYQTLDDGCQNEIIQLEFVDIPENRKYSSLIEKFLTFPA